MCLSRPSLEIFYYLLQNRQIHCGEVRFVVDTHQIHLALHLSGDDGIGDDSARRTCHAPFEAIAILIFRMPGLSSTPWNGFSSREMIRSFKSFLKDLCRFCRIFASLSNSAVVDTLKLIDKIHCRFCRDCSGFHLFYLLPTASKALLRIRSPAAAASVKVSAPPGRHSRERRESSCDVSGLVPLVCSVERCSEVVSVITD